MNKELDSRVQRAVEYFMQGYGCGQSVTAAFCDLYGLTPEQAFRIGAGFGGGVGKMRMMCGAVSGMFILAGMENGSVIAGDTAGRGRNYELVQELARRFKAHTGSIVCAELLGLSPMTPITPQPE